MGNQTKIARIHFFIHPQMSHTYRLVAYVSISIISIVPKFIDRKNNSNCSGYAEERKFSIQFTRSMFLLCAYIKSHLSLEEKIQSIILVFWYSTIWIDHCGIWNCAENFPTNHIQQQSNRNYIHNLITHLEIYNMNIDETELWWKIIRIHVGKFINKGAFSTYHDITVELNACFQHWIYDTFCGGFCFFSYFFLLVFFLQFNSVSRIRPFA